MYNTITAHQKQLLETAKKLQSFGLSIVTTNNKESNCGNKSDVIIPFSTIKRNIFNGCNGLGILGNDHLGCTDYDSKDFDNPILGNLALDLFLKQSDLINKVVIQQSPSGGRHVIFKTVEAVKVTYNQIAKNEDGKALITIRAKNSYVCTYPTPNYKILSGSFSNLQELTDSEYKSLLDFFKSFDKYALIAKLKQSEAENKRLKRKIEKASQNHSTDSTIEISVWDDFNNKNSVEDILTKNGFTFVSDFGGKAKYLRPKTGAKRGEYSGFVQNGLYVNFSDNSNLPCKKDGGQGRKFSAYDLKCYLEFDGDFSKCAAELYKDGYGKISTNRSKTGFKKKAPKTQKTYIEAKKGERLTDVVKRANINPQNSIIEISTGLGKTTWFSLLVEKRILLVPTQNMCKQVSEDFDITQSDGTKVTVRGATPFYGKEKGDIKNADFIVTTYHSLRTVADILGTKAKDYILGIDEIHNNTASTSKYYLLEQFHDIVELIPKFRYWVGLTGTNTYNFAPVFEGCKIWVIRAQKQKRYIHFVEAANVLKATQKQIEASILKGNFPLVLFNNTKDTGRLGTLRTALGGLDGIEYFSSKTKENRYFNQLLETGLIPSHIKGMVTTTVFKEGNNIKNEIDFDIIIVGNFHANDIEQLSNRPRKPKSLKIYVIRGAKREKSDKGFNPYISKSLLEEDTLNRCQELNTKDINESDIFFEQKALNYIQYFPIKSNQSKYEVDKLELSNHIYQYEKIAQNRNDALMLKALSRFNIHLKENHNSDCDFSKSEKAKQKQFRQLKRKAAKEQFLEVVEFLDKGNSFIGSMTAKEVQINKKLTEAERTAYNRYITLRDENLKHDSIIKILKDTGLSKTKFTAKVRQIHINKLYTSKDYMNSNRMFTIVLKSIYSKFDEKELYTVLEIESKIIESLKLDKSFNIERLLEAKDGKRIMKIAALFFNIERKSIRTKSGHIKKYCMCATFFNYIFLYNKLKNVAHSEQNIESFIYKEKELTKMLASSAWN